MRQRRGRLAKTSHEVGSRPPPSPQITCGLHPTLGDRDPPSPSPDCLNRIGGFSPSCGELFGSMSLDGLNRSLFLLLERERAARAAEPRGSLISTGVAVHRDVRSAISRIKPISLISRPSASAFATIASSRQHRSASGGASRIHKAVRRMMSAHLSRCRAMTLCKR